ncbi:alpha/beta hydrolase [Flavobacterium psychrophilum]|nr:alpha/beta hydrolase [Flavobacterium psychrophilum]AOE53741.1 alpha/beta hydrolase [Flavobacterium psychrophilum]
MGHNLNFNEHTGKYSFFSVQEKAWHNLGQIVSDYPTSAEAIQYAGLDYQIAKEPNTHILPSGKSIQSKSSFFTYRTDNDTVLGASVGKDYHIVQNREAFAFFDAIVGGSEGILYETAGALGQGERIFITAKLPGYIRVGNGEDVTEKYIFLTTAHDGSGSITAAFTPIRIVCQNTLNAALKGMSNVVRIKHTSGAKQRLEDAHKVMGLADRLSVELEGIFNNWASVKVADNEMKKLIELALCPNKETFDLLKKGAQDELSTVFKNTVQDAFAYAMISDTQQMETTKGTLFGAYNAVTGYYQNVRNYKDEEAKLQSLVMGGTARSKAQAAFDLCRGFADAGADIFKFN